MVVGLREELLEPDESSRIPERNLRSASSLPKRKERTFNYDSEKKRLLSERAEIDRKLEELERAQEEAKPVHALTVALHDKRCNWNHTDGCDYHYHPNDPDDPKTWSHAYKTYRKKAQEMLNKGVGIRSILELVDLL